MKKLLFVIHTLDGGGAEKVLVNLVNNLPREKYKITVASVFDGGVNKRFLKNDIEYIFLFKKVFRGNCFLFKNLPPEIVEQGRLNIVGHQDTETGNEYIVLWVQK